MLKEETCPKKAVGCVVVDEDDKIISTGYNGTPKGLPHCIDEVPCGGESDGGICLATHAEINALLSCRDVQSAATIYITCSPCPECMKAVLTTNIKNIVFGEFHKTWNVSKTMWPHKWSFMDVEDL